MFFNIFFKFSEFLCKFIKCLSMYELKLYIISINRFIFSNISFDLSIIFSENDESILLSFLGKYFFIISNIILIIFSSISSSLFDTNTRNINLSNITSNFKLE